MTVRIVLVDDHPVVRAGLKAVLESVAGLTVVGEAATGEEALLVTEELTPDIVLCDLRLGDGIDGIETTKRLRQLQQKPVVVMLTTYDRDAEILGALEAGASGYLLKDTPPEEIPDAVKKAVAGETVLSPELAARVFEGLRSPRPKLTERELDVLRLLVGGASNKEIAAALFVSEATVKSHLVHIFSKLEVDSRARAIRVAQDSGIV